jgi:hypothetical protein
VAKLTLTPTTVLSCRQVLISDGQLLFVEDARQVNLDTRGRHNTALKNATQVLNSGAHPDEILVDTPTDSLPMGDGTRFHGQNPLRDQNWVSNGVRDRKTSHGHTTRRQNIQLAVSWDGTDAKFRSYSLYLRGWMSQNGLPY